MQERCGKEANHRKVEATPGGDKPIYYCLEHAPDGAEHFDTGRFNYTCDRAVDRGLAGNEPIQA